MFAPRAVDLVAIALATATSPAAFGASKCADRAILQCRICVRPDHHGLPASKGIVGVDEELHVVELNGLVSRFETILLLVRHQSRHGLFHLFRPAKVSVGRGGGTVEPAVTTEDLAIDEAAASDVQTPASGDLQLYPRTAEGGPLEPIVTELRDMLPKGFVQFGAGQPSVGSGGEDEAVSRKIRWRSRVIAQTLAL